jgi:hypothetical protein
MRLNSPTRTAVIVVIVVLVANLCVCGWMSAQASGAQDIGPYQSRSSSIRSGSIGGPGIIGGGPSSGK